jgi:hypothetical protein
MRPAMLRLIRFATAPGQRRPWRALLAVLLVAITGLALVPDPPQTVSTGWDKSNHALAFASLAFAGVWAVWPRPRQWGLLGGPARLRRRHRGGAELPAATQRRLAGPAGRWLRHRARAAGRLAAAPQLSARGAQGAVLQPAALH